MLSRMGYTRRQAPHLRLSPFSLSTSGFLQAGQTRISSSSLAIMATFYAFFARLGPELKPDPFIRIETMTYIDAFPGTP